MSQTTSIKTIEEIRSAEVTDWVTSRTLFFLVSIDVMSQSVIVPPVHETSPPPFDDDDVDENDVVAITTAPDDSPSPLTTAPDVVDNSNDEWKSVDNNNDTDLAQVEDDVTFADPVTESADAIPPEEEPTPEKPSDDDGWANFAAFEPQSPEVSEVEQLVPPEQSVFEQR